MTHHSTPMTITLGYDLPFRAHAFTTPDDVLRIFVRVGRGSGSKALFRVQTHAAVFMEAALFGMGAGSRVPPRLDRRAIDGLLRVSASAADCETVLEAPIVVDPTYITVLLHKLLGLSELVPVEEVTVELPGLSPAREPIPIRRGETSALPELHTPLPFTLEDERSGHADGCTVSLLFAQPPGAPELDALQDGLRVWVAQALQGGFICPPMGPDDYFVSADDQVSTHGAEVTWAMESFELPAGSLHALVHFFAAYHELVAALRQVELA